MDRKNKVWLIVLIVLLIAAIAAVLGINGKYSGAKKALEVVSTQLIQSQESTAAFETELTAAQAKVTEVITQLATAENEKTDAQTKVTEMETQLAQVQAENAEYEAQLTAAEAELTAAEAQLTAAEVQLNELGVQLVDAQTAAEIYSQEKQAAQNTISTMEAVAKDYEARITELQSAITAAEAQIAGLIASTSASAEAEAVEAVEAVEEAEIEAAPAEEAEAVSEEEDAEIIAVDAEIFEGDATVDVEQIYEDIAAIINDESGDMSDAEKVAALDALKVQLSLYVEELNVALDEISAQEKALAASVDSIELLEAELVTAQANVDALNSAIAEGQSTIASLNEQIAALQAQNESNSAESQAQIEALAAQIAAEQANVEALTAQLADANAELAARLAELEVYKLERELSAGEAYTASTMGDVLKVAADGKTVAWTYTNDTISGNAVVLSIQIDGENVYTSALLQPGETLETIELTTALAAGEYAGVAVISVSDAEGAAVSSTRVPLTILVG